ncbi:MAG: alanyl-tRNA editing protein [Candidatus Micrarchaeaceae archaeon]
MTKKIYWTDAYRKELNSIIVSKSQNVIELDETIFYPTGGGQPCDTGTISLDDESHDVVETKKSGETVLHVLEAEPDFKEGDVVHSMIDWEKRYAHMRYHTATHIVGGIATGRYGAMFTGGQIYADRSRFDFDMQKLDRKLAEEMVVESQRVINQNLDVVARVLTREEAMNIPNIARTAPGQELMGRLTSFRVVEITGFDMQLDGGTHVSNTREIGQLELSSFENKGSRRKRMEIRLR